MANIADWIAGHKEGMVGFFIDIIFGGALGILRAYFAR